MLLGPPEPPEILNNETELDGREVKVQWNVGPDNNCLITMYTLYYRVISPATKDVNWAVVNISDTSVKSYELQLQYSKLYKIVASAWNKLGESKSKGWLLKTAQGKKVLR